MSVSSESLTTDTQRLPNVVIRASAGTGKTFQLSNRYLALLNAGVRPDQILATTFTRKAAGEILDRVIVRLAQAVTDEQKCGELREFLNDPTLTQDRCGELLQRLTSSLHRVRICTLDSFFAQIAMTFGFELKLPPEWRIVDTSEDISLRSQAVSAVLESRVKRVRSLMHLLAKGELKRSVSQLIHSTVDSLYAVFENSSVDAWSNLPEVPLPTEERLQQAIEELRNVPIPDNKTWQKAHAEHIRCAEQNDWDGFLSKGIVAKLIEGAQEFGRLEIPDEVDSAYQKMLELVRAIQLHQLRQQTLATYELLCDFDIRYLQLKDRDCLFRFDDVARMLAAYTTRLHRNGVEFRLDGSISHVLLDEFQDTAPVQWKVIEPFARYAAENQPGRSFFCVGDTKQAIYGWRGGRAEIFDAIEQQLPEIQTSPLNVSYRSSPVVIETVNRIFRNMDQHGNLAGLEDCIHRWQDGFEEHKTARDDLPGYAVLETAPAAGEDEGGSADVLACAAQKVAELAKQLPGRTIGVLTRTNDSVTRLIHELRRLEIHASEEGGNLLTDCAAVQLIMSLLRLADHPGCTVSRFHVARSPLGAYLSYEDFQDNHAADQLSRQLRRRLQQDGYGPVLRELADQLISSCTPRGRRRLQQFVEVGWRWQAQATSRTQDFLDYLALQKVPDPTSDRVRVMTIHQSKGLEFDVVVLPELNKRLVGQPGSFVVDQDTPLEEIKRVCRYCNRKVQQLLPPDIQKMFQNAESSVAAESLCVLYVAVTRAVHGLHMIIEPSKKSEKALPATLAGLLRAALTNGDPAEPGKILYENGNPQWVQTVSAGDTSVARSNADSLPKITLAAMPDGRRRGVRRVAPSSLEGSRQVKGADLYRPGARGAMERGTLIHAFFEQIDWLDDDDGVPDDTRLHEVAAETAVFGVDVDRCIAEFRTMLQQPAIKAGLSRKSYLPPANLACPPQFRASMAALKPQDIRLQVRKEMPIAVKVDSELVSGFIDRLVFIYDKDKLVACDLIDFKTDSVDASDADALQHRIEHYRGQIEAYRPAVSRLTGLPPERISARLYMVGAGVVCDV